MKKLISNLLIIFITVYCLYSMGSLFGSSTGEQEDVLTNLDTTALFGLPGSAKNIVITVTDSAMTGTDTLKAFLKDGARPYYSLLAVHEASQVTTTTNVTLMIPGNGVTSSYIIPDNISIQDLFIVRLNTGTDNNYLPKTRIVVRYVY